jgi:hypothetical protein
MIKHILSIYKKTDNFASNMKKVLKGKPMIYT